MGRGGTGLPATVLADAEGELGRADAAREATAEETDEEADDVAHGNLLGAARVRLCAVSCGVVSCVGIQLRSGPEWRPGV